MNFGEKTAIKLAGQLAELAPTYVFLASQEAGFVTGLVNFVTGGQGEDYIFGQSGLSPLACLRSPAVGFSSAGEVITNGAFPAAWRRGSTNQNESISEAMGAVEAQTQLPPLIALLTRCNSRQTLIPSGTNPSSAMRLARRMPPRWHVPDGSGGWQAAGAFSNTIAKSSE